MNLQEKIDISLPERHREVLNILISDYLASALPVGSQSIAQKIHSRLSPATIRHVMTDLTGMGLLAQPHTSAGRLPTVDGLRYYVDSLLEVHELSDDEQELVRRRCCEQGGDVQAFLRRTSSALSVFSRYVGLILLPGGEDTLFKHIEFLRLSRGKLLGIFVSQGGLVHNRLIDVDEDVSHADLEKINNVCHRAFVGLNLAEARAKVTKELEHIREDYDRLLRQAFQFSDRLLSDVPVHDVIIEHPEFAEFEQVNALQQTLEEKQRLLKLLDRTRDGEGVKIFIGTSSADAETIPATVVSAPYRCGHRAIGVLGVIGPSRMNYSHVVPIVDFTAKLVSDFLEGEPS